MRRTQSGAQTTPTLQRALGEKKPQAKDRPSYKIARDRNCKSCGGRVKEHKQLCEDCRYARSQQRGNNGNVPGGAYADGLKKDGLLTLSDLQNAHGGQFATLVEDILSGKVMYFR